MKKLFLILFLSGLFFSCTTQNTSETTTTNNDESRPVGTPTEEKTYPEGDRGQAETNQSREDFYTDDDLKKQDTTLYHKTEIDNTDTDTIRDQY